MNCKKVVEPVLNDLYLVCPTCGCAPFTLAHLGGQYQLRDRTHRRVLLDIAELFGVTLDATQSTHAMEDELRIKLKDVVAKHEAALNFIHWAGHTEGCHHWVGEECTCYYKEIVGDD